MKFIKMIGMVLLWSWSLAVQADFCVQLALRFHYPSYSLNTNPSPIIPFTVLAKKSVGDCWYFIGVSKGRSSNYQRRLLNQADSIPIQIYKTAGSSAVLKDDPDIVAVQDTIIGSFNVESVASTTYLENEHSFSTVLTVPTAPIASGTYQDTFTISLYQGRIYAKAKRADSATITYTYTVPPQVALSLVATGAPFDLNDTSEYLDFGTLETNEKLSFDLMVQANEGHKVFFSSFNNGRLKHATHTTTINYRLNLAGLPIDLTNSNHLPTLAVRANGITPAEGSRYPIQVQIGTIATQVAGPYQDTITITVESN